MMENGIGMSQGQDSSESVSQPVQSQPTQSVQASQSADERTFRQSEVSDLVRRAKSEAVESYRRQQVEQPQYVEQKYNDGRAQANPTHNTQVNELSDDRIRKLAAEEAQRHVEQIRTDALSKSQEEMAHKTVQNFWNKISTGKEKYQDFDEVTADIDYQRFPNVVQLLGDYIENSDDVLYELGKDRIKMANLEQLAQMSPRDAMKQAQRLSKSIKDNVDASKMKLPNAPLSQLRPSNTGTDNGAMSVGDYRKKYRA